LRALVLIVAVILLSIQLASAQVAEPKPAPSTDVSALYKTLVGDWIGVCEQSTDGQQAENKYFHACIKETGPDTYTSTFTYYRSDGATTTPIGIGDTTAVLTIQPDGTVKNEIEGSGSILVDKEPKQQTHKLSEVLTTTSPMSMAGKLTGKISVSGLPFGLGKNGEVSDSKSTYALKDDVLTICQTLKIGFKVLVCKKSYTITANSTARRGSDVSALMKAAHVAEKSGTKPAEGT
jgi:hypothetical protein